MTLNEYDTVLPDDVLKKVLALCKKTGMVEKFDSECDLNYTWTEDNKVVAVVAFKRQTFDGGRIVPRIKQIIFHPDYASKKKARSSFVFLRRVFVMVKDKGYDSVWAYVQAVPVEEYMKKMAIKLGFTKYSADEEGEYYSLNLG